MKTILYAFLFIAPNIFLSDSSESRSCSLKKLHSPGLGAVPQQAETHPFRGKRNGWVFAFVIQMHCLPVLYQTNLINMDAGELHNFIIKASVIC